MPNKEAGKKAMRQTKKNTLRNSEVKKEYKLVLKNTKKSVSGGDKDIKEKLRLAQKALDKAAKKGVIKKNTAARKLSRLMKQAAKVAKK